MMGQEEYPRFISNRPCGNDKYEGKSQERLAKAIAKHFKDTDSKDSKICLPRIVGLEGIWGSGKSNVIRLLEKKLEGEYYFFEYDAWGHQEDLQRRSDNYFTGLLPNKLDNINVLKILNKSDYYSFDKLYNSIEELIANDEITEENFANIYSAYKILSKGIPLAKQLNTSKVQSIVSALSNKISNDSYPIGYSDIVAMSIALGRDVPNYDSNIVTEVAENIEYYTTHGELLENCINWNISLLNEVLRYMVINRIGKQLTITPILQNFEQIKSRINVTEDDLLTHLSKWSISDNEITKDNIKTIISTVSFWGYSAIIKNDLTAYLNTTVLQALSEISETTLYLSLIHISEPTRPY